MPEPNKSKQEDNSGPELRYKRSDVRQHIKSKAQSLFATAENDSASQIAKETGLSRSLVRSWQQSSVGQRPDSPGELNCNGQLEDPPHAKTPSTPIPNQLLDHQQLSGENLEVSGRPDIHRASKDTAETTTTTRRRINQNAPGYASWLPESKEEKMNDVVELRRVGSALARWWWVVLILTLVAAAIGFAISLNLDPVYEATTSVIVGQSIQATSLDSRDIQTSERLALSYADIARRQPILEATNVSLNLGIPWQNLRKRIQVELIPDTQLLEISVEASSREQAILIADEIARQLILLSPSSPQNQADEDTNVFVQTRIEALQNKIEANQEMVDELSSEILVTATLEQKAELQAEISNLENLILDWENNYANLLTFAGSEESVNYLAVVETAHAKISPIRPLIPLNTIMAGTVGLILVLGIVLLIEFLDDTLKTTDDISRELNLIPLGSIGQFGGRASQERKIVTNDPLSPLTESYRMVRNNIQFMSLDRPGRSILVTSPGPDDGKTVTAVNLAVVMASSGQETIIVDTDLRKPKLHEHFQVPNGRGLTNKLRDTESKTPIPLVETQIKGVRLLTAGDSPPDPATLLGSRRMEQLIAELMDEADVLIFDSPPVAYIADAAVLSQQVDGVVLVVSSGKTRRDVSRQAVFNMQQASANILGVVLNRSAVKNGAYKYAYIADTRRSLLDGKRILAGLQRAWSSLTLAISWRRQ